jgi:hypothetical protein
MTNDAEVVEVKQVEFLGKIRLMLNSACKILHAGQYLQLVTKMFYKSDTVADRQTQQI